jgi:hypothetical protein
VLTEVLAIVLCVVMLCCYYVIYILCHVVLCCVMLCYVTHLFCKHELTMVQLHCLFDYYVLLFSFPADPRYVMAIDQHAHSKYTFVAV